MALSFNTLGRLGNSAGPVAPMAPPACAAKPTIPAVPVSFVPTPQNVLNQPEVSRIERIETAIGEHVNVSKRSPQDIAAVIRDGVLVKVKASFWRGYTPLTGDDVGFKAQDAARTLIANHMVTLGRKLIIPPDYKKALDTAAGQGRAALYRHALSTSHGYWIPAKKFAGFKQDFEEAKGKFHAAIKRIVDNRAKITDWIELHFRPLAAKSWLAIGQQWSEENGVTYAENVPEIFTEQYVEKIIALLPPDDEIEDAFLAYDVSILMAPDTALANEYATGDSTLNAELREHMLKKKKNLVDDFLVAAQQGLAESINAMVENVQQRLNGSDKPKVHGKVVSGILKSISDVRDLNVINDATITKALDDLDQFVSAHREVSGAKEKIVITPDEMRKQMEVTAKRIAALIKDESPEAGNFGGLD